MIIPGVFCLPYLCFGGLRAVYLNGLSQTAQITHSFNLTPKGASYHFNPVYVKPYGAPTSGLV